MTGTAVAPVLLLAVLVAGCAAFRQPPATAEVALAVLIDANGRKVATASFTEIDGGVRIVVDARGLPPGEKGVHLHAVGRCDPPAFTSAGAHLNPLPRQHGLLNPLGPHAGDLPNITLGADGRGRLETFTDRVTLGAGPTSLFDGDATAMVIHADPDDFRTDPAGNSGPRIACGVLIKPSPMDQ